eukprot:TRINITY_DN8046_c0_g1_i1.p1 TRINITY_DN8046_c0_g1~~TRINITY_DN8046_c0_g1_i1.p1  ORF type:complete len:160 (-),score=22.08 TRINITY_DN8046_c0_g1_i1:1111-1590(-)
MADVASSSSRPSPSPSYASSAQGTRAPSGGPSAAGVSQGGQAAPSGSRSGPSKARHDIRDSAVSKERRQRAALERYQKEEQALTAELRELEHLPPASEACNLLVKYVLQQPDPFLLREDEAPEVTESWARWAQPAEAGKGRHDDDELRGECVCCVSFRP